jgi:hypothetical protein
MLQVRVLTPKVIRMCNCCVISEVWFSRLSTISRLYTVCSVEALSTNALFARVAWRGFGAYDRYMIDRRGYLTVVSVTSVSLATARLPSDHARGVAQSPPTTTRPASRIRSSVASAGDARNASCSSSSARAPQCRRRYQKRRRGSMQPITQFGLSTIS